MAKTNLLKLAKGTNKKPAPAAKKVIKKEPVKPISPEEERNLKAKRKVAELLQDVTLSTIKSNDVLPEADDPYFNNEGNEWLEEQTAKLGSEVEILRSELANAKEDYRKLFEKYQSAKNGIDVVEGVSLNKTNDSAVANKVIELFNEIQSNYFAMGKNPNTGIANLVLPPVAFMNRMILFFPFLANEKRF